MPFLIEHALVAERLELRELPQGISPQPPGALDAEGAPAASPEVRTTAFRVSIERSFYVLYPGRLKHDAWASVKFTQREPSAPPAPRAPPRGIDDPGPRPVFDDQPRPLHSGVHVANHAVALELKIFTPDGVQFTRDEITREDLRRFRDARDQPRPWTCVLTGQSRTYELHEALHQSVTEPRGHFSLSVVETVRSASPAPLLGYLGPEGLTGGAPIVPGLQRFTFGLDRVGKFVAELAPRVPATLRLIDPDGTIVGSAEAPILTCELDLATLGPSRPGSLWTLEVDVTGAMPDTPVELFANVLGEGRIATAVLERRLRTLLGTDGDFLHLAGKHEGGQAKLVLTIKDTVAAETLDMHGVLDSLLRAQGMSTDLERDKPVTLFARDQELDYGFTYDVSTIEIPTIDVALGPAAHIPGRPPAVLVTLTVRGAVRIKFGDLTVATARVRGNQARFELGLSVDTDGTPRMPRWIQPDFLDLDISDELLAVAAGAIAAGLGPAGVAGVTALMVVLTEYFEGVVAGVVRRGSELLFDDPMLPARVLMTLLGGHFHHFPPRFDGDAILFEHVAPEESVPAHDFRYRPVVGGSATADTWAADNLKRNIKHIVVVMMENRSYDHVLGYRAQAPHDDGKDGLTPHLMECINTAVRNARAVEEVRADDGVNLPPMRPLRSSRLALNQVNRRTRIPHGVGHELEHVNEQLSAQIAGPDGRPINSPLSFVANFQMKKLHGQREVIDDEAGNRTMATDVLGYYEANPAEPDPNNPGEHVDDLPMYTFLARKYAYSDRYFCSHPGPTLPNRMYSLTGAPQADRLGQPILDNNNGENFMLARATTIYDVLARHRVAYRVYESAPSVTMLRMFARYATDDDVIRSLGLPDGDNFERLEQDVRAGDVPPLVVIEPAMHHYPENDDHPDADMWRGQRFISRVYDALRLNEEVWKHTLLVITYDEHGGLYDHVVPPVAEQYVPVVRDPSENPHRPGEAADGTAPTNPLPPQPGLEVAIPGIALGGTVASGAATPDVARWHALSPATADGTVTVPYGVRVPTFLVSPWIPADANPPLVFDHASILKTILATFCSDTHPFLGDRVNHAHSFEAFVTATTPRLDVEPPPPIPDLRHDGTPRSVGTSRISTPDLYRKRMREQQVDFHEVSGRLARMLGR